mgnify:CR=1 FL=1
MIQATPRMKFDWSHLMVEGVLFLLLTGMDEIAFFARVKFLIMNRIFYYKYLCYSDINGACR